MARSYELVRDWDEAPLDAVVITIRILHGRPMGEVACLHCPEAEEYEVADFPRPVAVAFERAQELCTLCGLARIVVVLSSGATWNPEWGKLLEPTAVRASVLVVNSGSAERAPMSP